MKMRSMMGIAMYSLILMSWMACQDSDPKQQVNDDAEVKTTAETKDADPLGEPVVEDSTKMLLTRNYEVGDTLVSPSGLKLVLTKKGTGQQAQKGMNVEVHYAGRLENGNEFDNSFKRGKPFAFPLGAGRVIRGWDEGIAWMRVGDKGTLLIPSELGYGPNGAGGSIPPNADLIFDVELISVKEVKKPKPFDVEGKKIEETPEGLKYIRVKENDNGKQAYANRVVSVHYTGYLEDGTIFDSSIPRGEPIQFPLGQNKVIKGWDIGIRLMKTGDKMRLIIPPDLAYGKQGAGNVIPPNATLIFDVELVDVKTP